MSGVTLGDLRFDAPSELPERDWFDLSTLTRRVVVEVPETRLAALPQPFQIVLEQTAPDGRVRAELDVAGDRHLDHLLVALGPDGEVVAPAEYRDRRRARAAALLAVYD